MAMVEEVASQCRARRLLIVANPSGSSSDDDTPLGSYYNGYSIAPSPPGAPLLREVTSPLPTSSNRPLAEYDGPSSSELYRPPHLPQTPQHMTSLPAPASIRYTQLARQQRPQSSSDSLLPSLRPLKKKIPLPSPQPIMPVTDTQPARPVPKENLALSVASDDSTWSPLVQRTATRSKRLPLRTDGSRPSSHPDPSPSSTQDNSISGTFMPPITGHFSLLKSASAPVKSGSKIWLQVEEIYETLDQLFPNHDVNTPITDIPSGATWSVTWAPLVIRVFDALLHLFAFSRDSLNRPLVLPNNRGVYTRRVGTKVQQPSVDDYATHVDSNPATPQPDTTASALNILHRDITRPNTMSTDEMFQCLTHHGCPDLTESMDPNAYSRHYIAPGGFGDIWKGELHDGTAVAIEVWRFRALDEDPGKISSVRCLLGVIVFEGRLGMVSKWMEEGNLQNYLENNPRVDRYPLCIQTAQGVEYLHYRNMTNILVSSDRKLKLTDFDYAIMAESTLQFSQTMRIGEGTPRWMAPELVLDEEENHRRNKQTDIYAAGMTFLETITGAVPYSQQCKTDISVLNALRRQQFPRRSPSFFGSDERGNRMWALLMKCWDHDPAVRPVASEVTTSLQTLVRETEPKDTF